MMQLTRVFWGSRIGLAIVAIAASLMLLSSPAQAQNKVAIDIPAGRLSSALRTLNYQANITVVGKSRGLSSVRTPAVRGRMTAGEALRRLLLKTPYRARRVNRRTYRIERRKVRAPATKKIPEKPRQKTKEPAPSTTIQHSFDPEPLIVTASKRDVTINDYPGGAQSLSLTDITAGEAAEGLDKLLKTLPVTSGTAFGSGRNKIFVRGIADSSFNGPTQSTIGLYLGEQRLIYSASNPDLRLYDMKSLELLEGPQGTLYGAGPIGGVMRIVPNSPVADETQTAIWASAKATKGGAPGFDAAAMINLPITKREALRAVVFHGQSGGYIDDSLRGLKNINRTRFSGGRLAFRSELSSDWTFDLVGLAQDTQARDAQYIDARQDGLTQRNSIAQPFRGKLLSLNASLNGYFGDIRLVSTTGIVGHDLNTRYESSALAVPTTQQVYDEKRKIQLLNHETRISNSDGYPLSWLIGISAMQHDDDYQQLITNTNGDDPPPLANIVYKIQEYALFGEASYILSDRFAATVGGRLAHTKGKTKRSFGVTNTVEPETDATRFLPMAALSFRITDAVKSYLRYQQGYRTGGITVEREENGDPIISRFNPDRVWSIETGIKGALKTQQPVSFSLAGYYLRWRDVQADLVDLRGFTITRNTGNAEIFGLTFQSDTEINAGLNLHSRMFLNHTRAKRLTPEGGTINTQLPNIASYSARLGLRYRHQLANGSNLITKAELQYTGRSQIDINLRERVKQGDYANADLSLVWRWPDWEVGIEADNITNTRGNQFAFGNPFTIQEENQQVPLRPFSLRLSGKVKF